MATGSRFETSSSRHFGSGGDPSAVTAEDIFSFAAKKRKRPRLFGGNLTFRSALAQRPAVIRLVNPKSSSRKLRSFRVAFVPIHIVIFFFAVVFIFFSVLVGLLPKKDIGGGSEIGPKTS